MLIFRLGCLDVESQNITQDFYFVRYLLFKLLRKEKLLKILLIVLISKKSHLSKIENLVSNYLLQLTNSISFKLKRYDIPKKNKDHGFFKNSYVFLSIIFFFHDNCAILFIQDLIHNLRVLGTRWYSTCFWHTFEIRIQIYLWQRDRLIYLLCMW